MKNIPYLFLHIDDDVINNENLHLLKDVEELHLYKSNHNTISVEHPHCSIYCFTEEQYHHCLEQGHQPHLCFSGNEILTSSLLKFIDLDYEIFWFPDIDVISSDMSVYISHLTKLNVAVCISFSSIFNANITNESSRQWLEKILSQFNNPLLKKEISFLDTEQYHTNNTYLYQKNQQSTTYNIVLGLFGDALIYSQHNYLKHNAQTILKTLDCQNCSYQNNCIDRGLGYIMHQYNYRQCIGIKLLYEKSNLLTDKREKDNLY